MDTYTRYTNALIPELIPIFLRCIYNFFNVSICINLAVWFWWVSTKVTAIFVLKILLQLQKKLYNSTAINQAVLFLNWKIDCKILCIKWLLLWSWTMLLNELPKTYTFHFTNWRGPGLFYRIISKFLYGSCNFYSRSQKFLTLLKISFLRYIDNGHQVIPQ